MENIPELNGVELELLERSKLTAREKFGRIIDKDFQDFAIRVMSIEEFEGIIKVGHVPDYKEAFMPNHHYRESDKESTDIEKGLHSGPERNKEVYGHYKEKKPVKNETGVSFNTYLHRNHTAKARDFELARKLVESMGQPFTEPHPIVDWTEIIAHQTQETSETVKTYDVALVLDINVINKANPKAGFSLPWGFVHVNDKEKETSKGNTVLGVVCLKDDAELEQRLIQLSSHADQTACPVFAPQGEVLFPQQIA